MKRRTAREVVVQSLYHIDMNEDELENIIKMVVEEGNYDDPKAIIRMSQDQDQFVSRLIHGVLTNKEGIDGVLVDYLKGWQMDRLSRVDLQILRLAVFELLYDKESPPKVVVNEAIDLAKHFGMQESGKFVNGVLGKMLKETLKNEDGQD